MFYLFYKSFSNCRDLGPKELYAFTIDKFDDSCIEKLNKLGKLLSEKLKSTSKKCQREYPSGIIEYYEYYPSKAIEIINNIDTILSTYYNCNSIEIDEIIHYDIKYRMGDALFEEKEA